MKTIRISTLVLKIFLFFGSVNSFGQDFTLSQFQSNAHVFNPACIGSSGRDLRMLVAYRNQWFASGFPYQTFLVSGEMKINPFPKKLRQAAVSLVLADDQIGDGQWRNTWISGGVSATKNLDAAHKHSLAFGISSALLIRQFNAKNLLFENQFESSSFSFNPEISAGENTTGLRQGFFQINSGLFYQFEVSSRLSFGLGASGLWLYRPNEALSNIATASSLAKMNSRITSNFSAKMKLSTDFSIEPQCFFSQQGKAREFNFGGWFLFTSHLQNGGVWETGIGAFSRLNDSFIPAVRLGNGKLNAQLSYDATFSNVKYNDIQNKFIGIGGMGALEFTIIYNLDFKSRAFKRFLVPCQTF